VLQCVAASFLTHTYRATRATLQCVAVCCSVLQCVAVCCSMYALPTCLVIALSLSLSHAHIQSPPGRHCSVLQCVAVCCSVLKCVAVCCSVLQCVAVCCSVLQCVAVCCRMYTLPTCLAIALLLSLSLTHIQNPPGQRCSVLHCVAVCCSVLQCIYTSHMPREGNDDDCSGSHCEQSVSRSLVLSHTCRDHQGNIAMCCSVLQCVAVCCSVLQCVAV